MLNLLLILFAEPKLDPARKLGSTIRQKTRLFFGEEQIGEPDQTREPEGPHPEATFDEPPLQDQNIGEQPEVDPAVPDTEPAAPNQASPVRGTDTPSSPAKTTEGQGDDVIITGMGHSSPGHPVILA